VLRAIVQVEDLVDAGHLKGRQVATVEIAAASQLPESA
jgi:hypothetical protein